MEKKRGRPALTYETIPLKEGWVTDYAEYQAGEQNITYFAYINGVNRKTVYKYFGIIAKHRNEVFPRVSPKKKNHERNP